MQKIKMWWKRETGTHCRVWWQLWTSRFAVLYSMKIYTKHTERDQRRIMRMNILY